MVRTFCGSKPNVTLCRAARLRISKIAPAQQNDGDRHLRCSQYGVRPVSLERRFQVGKQGQPYYRNKRERDSAYRRDAKREPRHPRVEGRELGYFVNARQRIRAQRKEQSDRRRSEYQTQQPAAGSQQQAFGEQQLNDASA
jgi:hypothetical protein